MRRVALITGADGFVGQRLSAYLIQRDWQVCGAVLPGSSVDDHSMECDVSDPAQVDALFRWADSVSHVFHLAAVTFVPLSSRDPAHTMQVNLGGTIYVADALRRLAPNARLVFVGSAAIYGAPRALPVDEAHPLEPKEPYAISKAAADAYCEYASRAYALDVIRMRPFNHSGPGQSPNFVLSDFAKQIAEIEAGIRSPVMRVGNLEAARDFLHVQDVLAAYELAALQGEPGEAYNVCSGKSHSILEALNILQSLSSASIQVETDPARLRAVDIPTVRGSHAKFTRRTGWKPTTSFEFLLRGLLEYWRERCAADR